MKKKNDNIIVLDFKNKSSEGTENKNQLRALLETLGFSLIALIIGAVTGVIDAFFGTVLLKVTEIREENIYYFIPFLAIAGLLIVFLYDRFGKEVKNGMTLIIERAKNNTSSIKLRLIPFVTLSTWITHLFGGSAGREGVAVQIGGTLGSFVSQKFSFKEKSSAKILTISGMAAGFGGLFRTPMAAVFFATEVGLEKFSVVLGVDFEMNINNAALLCLAGVVFGITGGAFAFLLKKTKKLLADLIKNPYVRIAIVGLIISAASLLLYSGRYSGLGTNLINAAVNGGEIYYWDFALKMAFTIITVSAGFQGGEVTPLFSIGSALGAVMAMLFGLPVPLVAALGYAAVFGAATNTIIAPVFIGAEIFGYEYLPYFFAVCVLAYSSNGNNSIYTYERKKRQNKLIRISKD